MALKTRRWKKSFPHTTFERCINECVFDIHNDGWFMTSGATESKAFLFALALSSVIEVDFYGGNYITMKLTPTKGENI